LSANKLYLDFIAFVVSV